LLDYPIVGEHRRDVVSGRPARAISAAERRLRVAVLPLLLAVASLFPALATAKPSSTPFSIEPGSFEVTPSSSRAGAHADLTIAFAFGHAADGRPFNDLKDTVVRLPAGFAGALSAVPTCTDAQLIVIQEEELKPQCPAASQIGTVTVDFTFALAEPARMTLPLFNMAPTGPNASAELGFKALVFSQLVPLSIRPGSGGLIVGLPDVPLFAEPSRISITIWGVPASPSHDAQRGQECLPSGLVSGEESCAGGGNPANVPVRPFLDNPTRCGAARATMEADSWEEPESWSEAEAEVGPIAECELVPFEPSIEVRPTSDAAESPAGLDLSILEPQNKDDPEATASSSLAAASLTLPEGLSIDPAAISGVGLCTPEELERETSAPAGAGGCPPAAKLGSAEIETPLLEEPALGSIYMAKPFDGSPGSLPGLYVVARVPGVGGSIELTARLLPDRSNGRLRVSFDEVPQLPLSRLALHLGQGRSGLLATPATCGPYAAEAELTPSSDPVAPRHEAGSFRIRRGASGGSCPGGGGPPFHPSLSAGSQKATAGAFSPFRLHLAREDGEAPFGGLSLRLPPGLVANLASVAVCPEAALASASAETGAEERADPSCPAASEVGHTRVGMGVGSQLASVRGSVYLAGPYAGAPLSLAAVTPALLGPLDLGTVVVREGLRVSPRTGEIVVGSVGSDPIPRLVDGLPLHLRELNVFLDRRRFVRNPTGCKPLPIQGTATAAETGSSGSLASPPVALSVPYRVAACGRLRFAPRLRLRLFGGVHRNGNPGLRFVLASRRGESGLAAAAIDLPHTELLDAGHIHGICTSRRFAARRCPGDSIYGFAKASTPFLSEPLKGHLYLRSTKRGLPSLAAALHSRELDFDFVARLEARGGSLRIAPEGVPDLPISKLVLATRGGRGGILVNSVDLCAAPRRAMARLTARDGRRLDSSPRLIASCPRHGGGAGPGRRTARGRRRR
jgi:hypothetical protein